MANAGPNTNDTQFFVTTGTPAYLDFKHTIFGQLVSGSNILTDMTAGFDPVKPCTRR